MLQLKKWFDSHLFKNGAEIWVAEYVVYTRLLLMAGNIYYYDDYCASRYFAIVRPMQYSRKMTRNRANGLLIFAWCLGLVCALPPLFGWSAYVYINQSFISLFIVSLFASFVSRWIWNTSDTPVSTRILAFNWCAQNLYSQQKTQINRFRLSIMPKAFFFLLLILVMGYYYRWAALQCDGTSINILWSQKTSPIRPCSYLSDR